MCRPSGQAARPLPQLPKPVLLLLPATALACHPACPPARPPAGEEGLLEQLATIAHSGLSPADHLLALYEGRWGEDVGPVFEELHY